MHYSETEEADFKREFSRRRKRQRLLVVVLAPMIIGVVAYQKGVTPTILGLPPQVVAPIFLVLVVGALLFSLRNWRCPACSKYLGRSLNPRYCLNCGVELRV
jgi:O-antigen/teichoic acid export membrane protein